MSQEDAILVLLRNGPKTTNEIIQAPYGLAAEYRRAMTTLRKKGYMITYAHGKGGTGTYTLVRDPDAVGAGVQKELF